MASQFAGRAANAEFNFMLKPVAGGSFESQLEQLDTALQATLAEHGLDRHDIVFSRFFCDDLPGHFDTLCRDALSVIGNGAISVVMQPPAGLASVALWVYCAKGGQPTDGPGNGRTFTMKRGELEHSWTTGLTGAGRHGCYAQTHAIYGDYEQTLADRGMDLPGNCMRTWFYIRDVDKEYGHFVNARNEVFSRCGLTPDTHYIASTGIQAAFTDTRQRVMMDAYAIKGVRPEQVTHLKAPGFLSDTGIYGVRFERATMIAYRDRKHVLVSGTASIDADGEVVHVGHVALQLQRTLENIKALLETAGATLGDMQHFIAYVRHPAEVGVVQRLLEEHIGGQPFLVVTAPVCRPDWLVEIEGIAITANHDDSLPEF